MSKSFAAMVLALACCAPGAAAQGVPQDELAYVRTHMDHIVQLRPERLSDAAVTSVFAVPIYRVKIIINDPNGNPTTSVLVGRSGSAIQVISQPSEGGDCPELHKLLKTTFKLNGDAAAATVQSALDVLFPLYGPDADVKAIRHTGNEWTFVRGKFFENATGFILTTDATGRITGVRGALKLPA